MASLCKGLIEGGADSQLRQRSHRGIGATGRLWGTDQKTNSISLTVPFSTTWKLAPLCLCSKNQS